MADTPRPEPNPAAETSNVGSIDRSVDIEQWLHIYEQMLKIRHFEEMVNELYKTAKMPGLAHLYSGEEAVAVGVCEALRQRRLHHQHPSRAWALPGERRTG